MTKKLILLTALISTIFCYGFAADAQETGLDLPEELQVPSEGFTIQPANPNTTSPRKFLFELRPGEAAEDYVYVKNLSKETSTFLLYGADPTVSAQGTPAYKTRQIDKNGNVTDSGPGSWIKFEPEKITIEGKRGKLIKFTVSIPPDAEKGHHRAGIAMEKSKKDVNNPGITIATRVILHTDINVTDNPAAISKKYDSEIFTKEKTNPRWQYYYFLVSLILFIASFTALIIVTLREKTKKPTKKTKKTASKKKRTKAH